jgi:hypothetical protein
LLDKGARTASADPSARSVSGTRKSRRTPDPRIEQAWERVVIARRVFGVAAVIGFGAAIALARVTYAGHPKQTARPLTAPTKFVQVVRQSFLKSGAIAPAQAPPTGATTMS